MPYIKQNLPELPVREDVWDKLQKEKRPIIVYGMGNGADKLIERFSKFGIEIADFFASDGFVRGHLFHGKRVKSFSEIKREYPEFVIVLSFASNRDDVIEMLCEIDKKYDMYVPDMPIAEKAYFDKEFYNENYNEILKAQSVLSDEESKCVFASVINYRLSGKMSYLLTTYSEKDEKYALLKTVNIETVIDGGAYNGDTAKEAVYYIPTLKTVYAVEPDPKNYKKLEKFSLECSEAKIIPINSALSELDGEGEFFGSGNRNSTISATKSYECKSVKVATVKADSITEGKIDYIKYDVEGSELSALIGSHKLIDKYRPALSVSLYHKSEDLFSLINYLYSKYPDYKFYLRRTRCIPAWEIDLIMIPGEKI